MEMKVVTSAPEVTGKLNTTLVEKWHSADPSKGQGLGRLGTIGDIITDPKTLQHFNAVKGVEIYVADIKPRGSLGEHHTNVGGKPIIYIDPTATEKTLWEEIIHADRAMKGRPMGEVAEPSAKAGREFFIKPSELNKKLRAAGFSQKELEQLTLPEPVTPTVPANKN